MGRLAGDEGRGGGDANGAVGGALALEQLAAFIGDLGDLERGMKAEVDHVEIGGRGEADLGGGREVVRRGIQFGVNHIAGDIQCRALALRGRGNDREGEAAAERSLRGARVRMIEIRELFECLAIRVIIPCCSSRRIEMFTGFFNGSCVEFGRP